MVETISNTSALAEISIVNYYGNEIYHSYVKPKEKIIDFRTSVSGIKPYMLKNAKSFEIVQKEVSDIIENRIVIGHSLANDFNSLLLSHPKDKIRDTSTYKPFKKNKGGTYSHKSLQYLAKEYLHKTIQKGEHSPAEDARAALELYKLVRGQWEKDIFVSRKKRKINKSVEKSDE